MKTHHNAHALEDQARKAMSAASTLSAIFVLLGLLTGGGLGVSIAFGSIESDSFAGLAVVLGVIGAFLGALTGGFLVNARVQSLKLQVWQARCHAEIVEALNKED